MTERTPTPWYHRQAGELGKLGQPYDWIGDSPNRGEHRRIIVERNSCEPADYAFIVHAVNNHESLVEALVRAREAVNAIVLSTHSISFDADLRAIDTALAGAGVTTDDVSAATERSDG